MPHKQFQQNRVSRHTLYLYLNGFVCLLLVCSDFQDSCSGSFFFDFLWSHAQALFGPLHFLWQSNLSVIIYCDNASHASALLGLPLLSKTVPP